MTTNTTDALFVAVLRGVARGRLTPPQIHVQQLSHAARTELEYLVHTLECRMRDHGLGSRQVRQDVYGLLGIDDSSDRAA